MMRENFNPQFFNKKVGYILLKNRTRSGLSRTEVSQKIKDLSPLDLNDIENGRRSLPCTILYQLLNNVYSPTEKEVMFFCCPIAYLNNDEKPHPSLFS